MEVLSRLWFLLVLTLCVCDSTLSTSRDERVITIPMPSPKGVPKHNDYLCASVPLPKEDRYIVRYEPRADARVAHHMLMFGCSGVTPKKTWSCKSGPQLCRGGGFPKILYAWALNASGLQLPPEVGMKIGPSASITTLIIQIHYGHPETVPDLAATSKQALLLHTTKQRQPYVAGIFLMGSGSSIPSGLEKAFADASCRFTGPKPIFPFAFRTHAHSLGEQIVGYIVKPGEKWELIGTRSPQEAQAFYPAASNTLQAGPGDYLAIRCVFNTKGKSHSVGMGPDSEDEMCNFYIMYYTANDGRSLYEDECWGPSRHRLHYPDLPPLPEVTSPMEHHHHGMGGGDEEDEEEEDLHTVEGNKESEEEEDHKDGGNKEEKDDYKCPKPIPPGDPSLCSVPTSPPPPLTTTNKPFIEGEAKPSSVDQGLVQAEDWALNDVSIPGHTLGQVSAVAIDNEGNVHILHRGDVTWGFTSFNMDHTYRHMDQGPIHEPTLLKFSSTGTPQYAWGEDLFYLPHGLTIDPRGAFWVTDVAMHQVFRFSKLGATRPDLTLGIAFKPGDEFGHFCQPASVAVEESGVFYIADGYCNHRVLKFDSMGNLLETWDSPIAALPLYIPHKATLSRDQTTLYVADRENMRVVSFNTKTGASRVFSGPFRHSVYAISVNSTHDWPMYGVFGGEMGVVGFTLNKQGEMVSTWGPEKGFSQPHDLAVDPVHRAVYVTEIGPNRIWKFVPLAVNSAVVVPSEVIPTTGTSNDSPPAPHTSQPPPPPSQPPPASHPPPVSHPPPANIVVSETHDHKWKNTTTQSVESADDNRTANAESADDGHLDNAVREPSDAVVKQATFNVGIFVAIFVVVLVVLIVVFGILREHRYLRKLRLYVGSKRKQHSAANGGGVSVETRGKKGKPKSLHSLLGPSRPGFSRLKTYDSDSEAEEFPVFNRV